MFKTTIGACGITWSAKGIASFHLPEKTPEETGRRLRETCGASPRAPRPSWVRDAISRVQDFLSGKGADLSSIPLDLHGVPEFHARVYQAARKIPGGKMRTYGEIAREAGSPYAARAVGQALARNPIPVIIPCHRVVASGNKPGGFSAYGALETKAMLLAIEGADLYGDGRAPLQAVSSLIKKDKTLAALVRRAGPFTLKPDGKQEPFHAFLESILYQQLTAKAAATILQRLKNLFPHKNFPTAQELLKLTIEELRAIGVSRNKAAALLDLAGKVREGAIPSLRQIRAMKNEEIVEQFTRVRGIGKWTVEMFLIFNLGRMDVLPSTDYGVRKGFAFAYGLKKLPTPGELEKHGERWRPYRTIASWYLWRAVDLSRKNGG